ncbi:MAG: hypothetical protein WCD68_04020, partial [Candidatus Acidiferrum sp.]
MHNPVFRPRHFVSEGLRAAEIEGWDNAGEYSSYRNFHSSLRLFALRAAETGEILAMTGNGWF